jgi:hypothetical protein
MSYIKYYLDSTVRPYSVIYEYSSASQYEIHHTPHTHTHTHTHIN